MRITISKDVADRMQKYLKLKHPAMVRIGITHSEVIDQLLKDEGF